jgi:sec-independent protein translocase protein TatA
MRPGLTEILVILGIALLLFGAGRLADIGKGLGEGIRNFKKGLRDDDDKLPPAKTKGKGKDQDADQLPAGKGKPAGKAKKSKAAEEPEEEPEEDQDEEPQEDEDEEQKA